MDEGANSTGLGAEGEPGRALGDLLLLPLDDDLVAFSEAAQVLVSLNRSAALVLSELQKGTEVSEIARELAAKGIAQEGQAAQWVQATLEALGSHGVLPDRAVSGGPGRASADSDEPRDVPPYGRFRVVTEQRYRLLETCALVRFSAWSQARMVNSVLGHLATDEGCAPTVVYELKGTHLPNYAMHTDIYRDGRPAGNACRLVLLGPTLKGLLWQSAINAHDFSFYIHAGVVRTGQSCVLLPAAPGSGKSTLTAALINRGFGYFSDEVALIEPKTFLVSPMPLAMAIKDTGWDLMARYYPGIEQLPIHVRCDGKILRYVPPPEAATKEQPAPVSHIIFPRYEKDSPTRLEPLSRVAALGRLMDECLGVRRRLEQDTVCALIGWIGRIDCYELSFSGPEPAADLIVKATGQQL